MTKYRVLDGEGKERIIEGPPGATDEEILARARELFGEPEEQKPMPPKVSFGEEAEKKAMEEELAAHGSWDKFWGAFGAGLDKWAMRLKQATGNKLTPTEEGNVRMDRQMETAGPAGFTGGLAGNVAMAGPLVRGGIAAGEQVATRLPTAISSLAGMAARAFPKTATAAGAAVGGAGVVAATQPTLEGESEASQAALGAAGGTLGAGVAGSLPMIVRGAKALLGTFASKDTKITRETVSALTDAMRKDGLDPRQVFSQAAKMADETGRPVTIADIIGDDVAAVETRRLLQSSLRESEGPGRASVLRDLAARPTGQRGRVLDDISETLGTSKLPRSEVFDELAKTKSDEARPLYDKAFSNPTPVVDERLTAMMDRPSMVTAFKQILNKAKEQGKPLDVTYTLDPNSVPKALLTGNVTKQPSGDVFEMFAPSTKNLDTVKKKLFDVETSLKKAGHLDDARDVSSTRKELTKLLDEIAPEEYKQARKVWGDYSDMEEAFTHGTNLFKLDPAVISKTVMKASEAERDAFASGIFAGINEMSSKEGLDWAGNNLLRDTRKMTQLRAAFGEAPGSNEAFSQFVQRLKAESAMMRSSKIYPPTGRSTHMAGTTPGEAAGMAVDAAHGNAGSAILRLLKRYIGRGGMSTPAASEVSRLGFTPADQLSGDPTVSGVISQVASGRGRSSIPKDLRALPPLEALQLRPQRDSNDE